MYFKLPINIRNVEHERSIDAILLDDALVDDDFDEYGPTYPNSEQRSILKSSPYYLPPNEKISRTILFKSEVEVLGKEKEEEKPKSAINAYVERYLQNKPDQTVETPITKQPCIPKPSHTIFLKPDPYPNINGIRPKIKLPPSLELIEQEIDCYEEKIEIIKAEMEANPPQSDDEEDVLDRYCGAQYISSDEIVRTIEELADRILRKQGRDAIREEARTAALKIPHNVHERIRQASVSVRADNNIIEGISHEPKERTRGREQLSRLSGTNRG